MKRGLILNNIGTPEAPREKEVKAYLDEFLMDKNVIGAPWPIRFCLSAVSSRRDEARSPLKNTRRSGRAEDLRCGFLRTTSRTRFKTLSATTGS